VRSTPSGLDGFIPHEIDVTGSLGSTGSPLGSLALLARGDVLMGSAAFISAAQADPGFDALASSRSEASPGAGHVFLAAQTVGLGAEGRILQQNSASDSVAFAGLNAAAPTGGQTIVISPSALSGQTIGGGGGWTAAYSSGPTRIDLFGTLTKSDGTKVNDATAANLPNLLDPSIKAIHAYRINGCIFATPCVPNGPPAFVAPPVTAAAPPPPPPPAPAPETSSADAGQDAPSGPASSSSSSSSSSSGSGQKGSSGDTVFTMFRAGGSSGGDALGDTPITGSGNSDLWTGGKKGDQPQ
jgi:hypothetical protein